jgi:ubiquitin C-terminal hydrolase
MYRYLSIDIDGWDFDAQNPDASKASVDRCLELFFSPGDREIKCEKCEDGRIATQTMKILSQPKAILLHLKRFVLVETQVGDIENDTSKEISFRKNKVCPRGSASLLVMNSMIEMSNILTLVITPVWFSKAPVELNKHLSLHKFLAEQKSHTPSRNYTLKSIVHHIGKTANSGHYTADALRLDPENETPQWVSYDDGITEETNEAELLGVNRTQRTAYMLLYSIV